MRAFTLDSFDTSPGLREDLPTPKIGDDQLLIRVRASSVNPVDAFIASGILRGMVEHEYPVVLGRDYAGVVEQAGAAVDRYAAGDAVFGFLLHANPTVHEGTWAELIVVPQDQSVARQPAGVDMGQAGAASLAGLTALAAHDALGLREGATVLVVGASGGVGSFAVQLAAGAGATVVAPGLAGDGAIWAASGSPRSSTATATSPRPCASATPTGSTPCSTWSPPALTRWRPMRPWSARAGGLSPASARPATAQAAPTSAPSPARSRWSASPGC
jgi:NADPH:quinone reductase-like Zn-dependent oxidoreductase